MTRVNARLASLLLAASALAACERTATVALIATGGGADTAAVAAGDTAAAGAADVPADGSPATVRDALDEDSALPEGTPDVALRDAVADDPWLDALRDTLADAPRGDAAAGFADALDDVAADTAVAADSGDRTDDEPIHVVVISDLNSSYGSTTYRDDVVAAVDRIVGIRPDLVLSTGDMVAGQRAGLDYRAMWRGFHAVVSDPLADAGIPFAVTPGNHDASDYPGFENERAIYASEWRERRPDVQFLDDSNYPFRYSFRVGPALFVALDSTRLGPLEPDQMAWLQAQLANHAAMPIKIVFGHVPLYPFTTGRQNEIIGDPLLEDMLNHYGVDAFISGHHHAYYPGRRDDLRLVGMPCAGDGARALIGTDYVSEQAIVEFWITPEGIEELDGYGGISMNERIERYTLPEFVGAGATMIMRDDLFE
jgi:hypothetical protein